MIGVVPTAEALRMAREAGLDLVEISPTERPPVCKIMDFGKHKYDQSKKQKQKHHEQRIKEVRLRPKTDEHDREIKLKRARGFLEHGDRVQFTMLFRGRERFRQDVGLGIFNEIVQALEDIAKVDRAAKAMGRRMTMVLAPLKAAPGAPKPKQAGQVAKPAGTPRAAEAAVESAEPAPTVGQKPLEETGSSAPPPARSES